MSRFDALSPEFQSLLWAACRDDVTQEELSQLEQLADANSAMQLLVDYLQLDGELHRIICQQSSEDKCFKMLEVNAFSNPQAIEQVESVSPVFPLFSTIAQGTLGCFSSGWPVAYLIATVIFGIGLLIGSHVYMSGSEQLARQSAPNRTSNPQSLIPNPSPKAPLVGRITGMVDCQWAQDPKSEIRNPKQVINHQSEIINPSSPVSLGDKFVLTSGLMEITYDTGAKVILQGPVTYEVESNGGFLSVGELTGRLEKRVASGQWLVARNDHKSVDGTLTTSHSPLAPPANPQSSIPNPFTIHTPTATVTDLGTEFGVEVPERGDTVVSVFAGEVACQSLADGKSLGTPTRMTVNQTGGFLGQPGSRRSHAAQFRRNEVVRQIPRPRGLDSLSLADFVAGGNGFGQWVNWGIHPGDASFVPIRFNDAISSSGKFQWYTGDRKSTAYSFPKAATSRRRWTLAGHTFRFPKTRGTTFGPILGVTGVGSGEGQQGDYATPRAAPCCCSMRSRGITFDLVELKAAAAGRRPTRFQAVVVNQPHEAFDPTLGADVWLG